MQPTEHPLEHPAVVPGNTINLEIDLMSLRDLLTGLFFSVPALLSAPFVLSGSLKIIYDLTLFREFRSVKPPEENKYGLF